MSQPGGPGVGQQLFQLPGFVHGRAPSDFGETVVTAAFVVVGRVWPLLQFLDVAFFEESLDGAVKGAGAQAHFAAGALADLLHDGISVAVAIGQRHQDVKGVPRKSKRPQLYHTSL